MTSKEHLLGVIQVARLGKEWSCHNVSVYLLNMIIINHGNGSIM